MKYLFVLILTLVSATVLQAQSDNGIIIKLKKSNAVVITGADGKLTGLPEIDTINKAYNFVSVKKLNMGKKSADIVLRISFPEDADIKDILEKYRQSGLTEYAEPDFKGSGAGVMASGVNDGFYSRQWGLKNNGTFPLASATPGADIDMENAWDIEEGSADIIVAVMDSGIRINHPEFAGRIWVNPGEVADNGIDDDDNGYIDDTNGWDFVNIDNIPADDYGHGTNVAGIIAANGNNAIGYAGVDRNCKIMPLKGLDDQNSGSYSWWVEAITYAADNGADVINLSVGGNSFSATLQSAVGYALDNDVVVVACMMNTNNSVSYYPARFSGVIAVGATNPDDTRVSPFFWSDTSGSNFGTHLSVVAPGNYIYGLSHTSNTDYNTYWGGTSQATPLVAGIAALLRAQDPSRTPAQIKSILESTAEDQVGDPQEDTPGFDIYYGHGRLNAFNALSAPLSVTENNLSDSVAVFPNPSTGNLTILPVGYPATAVVYNTLGQLVIEREVTDGNNTISLTKPGIYIVVVTTGNTRHSETVIIQ